MKAKWLGSLILLSLLMFNSYAHAQLNKKVDGDATPVKFVFVENDNDDNYFVTPGGVLDPRMTGASDWTGLKADGTGFNYQQSLGYINDGFNRPLTANNKFDMWIENSPASNPLLGLRCINWYKGCDMATSLIQPKATDNNGFYGVTVPSGGAMWMHGMISGSLYQYLQQIPVGGSFSMIINTCQTSADYDASSGARCIDQASGEWHARRVTHTKGAHLKLLNTGALSDIYVNSDGVPTLGEGNIDCKIQTINGLNGVSCKMISYNLQVNSLSNSSIHIFPSINNSNLASKISSGDMQFSLDGNSWKKVNGISQYYTFNEMKSSSAVYLFFSSNFFKQLVGLGLSDINTKNLFNFRFQNTTSPESGWYEFSTSSSIDIKPRDFSVSIISDEYTSNPHHEGNVGEGNPSLDFGYIVTTSGKTKADEVLVKVTGPAQDIGGRSYCIFSSPDNKEKVPFPATLSFFTMSGDSKSYDTGCDDKWHDMTDAMWTSSPWNDSSGAKGEFDKANVKFSIQMDDKISQKTVENNEWFGEVSASGEIHVKATWRHIN